jgi:hypothetical protein
VLIFKGVLLSEWIETRNPHSTAQTTSIVNDGVYYVNKDVLDSRREVVEKHEFKSSSICQQSAERIRHVFGNIIRCRVRCTPSTPPHSSSCC